MNARLLTIALMLAGATAGCTKEELAAVGRFEEAWTGETVAAPEPALVALAVLPEPEPAPAPEPEPVAVASLPDNPPTPVCVPVFRVVECSP